MTAHESGDLEAAEAGYRRVLKRDPKYVPALVYLGILLNRIGDHRSAIELLGNACRLAGREHGIRLELARVQMEAGALADARATCREAMDLAPTDLATLRLQAEIDERLDDIPAAMQSYEAILALDPAIPEIHNNLGILHRRSGDTWTALACYDRALALRPNYAVAWNNRANAFKDLDRIEPAIASYREAIALDPGYTEAHLNLGRAYQRANRIDDAIETFERILTIDPDNEEARLQIAETLLSGGRFDLSAKCLDEILTKNDRCAEAYYLQSQQKRHTSADLALVHDLEVLGADPALGDEQRLYLDFALGKIFDDLGAYDDAFECYQRGNRRKSALCRHEDHFAQLAASVMDVLTAGFFAAHPAGGNPSRAPIFVVGMPRSGTTLVEQRLAAHPAVFGAGESTFFWAAANSLHGRLDTDRRYPDNLADATSDQLAAIGDEFLGSFRSRMGRAQYVVDKMPENFLYLGFIKLVFPEARIIHCRRNPLDTCLSIYFQLFGGDHPYAYDLDTIASRYLDYCRLMAHWHTTFGEAIHEVDYESLVTDHARVTRDLFVHCGLRWDEQYLSTDPGDRLVATTSRWQVRQPIYRHAVGRWKNYEKHLALLRERLAAVLSDCGGS